MNTNASADIKADASDYGIGSSLIQTDNNGT